MKKILSLMLVLIMVLAFAACSDDTDKTPASDTDVETPAPDTDVQEPAASDADIDTPKEETPAIMSHADYIAAELDANVVVETYVQAHQSWWENKITVYCQSPDGAYFVYELACSEADAAKLVPGTKIRVTGTKGEWAGEVEVMNATFEFVEGADTFVAEAFDATALLGTDELIAHQNEFVSFKGMTVEKVEFKNGKPGDDIYVTLGKDGKSYEFCVEIYLTGESTDVYKAVSALTGGELVDVEGFLYWYEGMNPHITAITLVDEL